MVLVTVVVLGDIGRSPRMQYHCASLASHGYNVDVVGYGGSKPIREITDNNKVTVRNLKDCPPFQEYMPRLFAYVFKTLWQLITLFLCLYNKDRSDFVLAQSPPAIPTLFVCWFYCFICRAHFIIDWHNYAFENMALTLGKGNILVKITYWFEGFFGRRSRSNFCVTEAMKQDLKKRWNISAVTVYDKPFSRLFTKLSLGNKHDFFMRISKQFPIFSASSENSTIFTSQLPNKLVALRQSRPALLVSSTSWTDDEDFSILLTALKVYDKSEVCALPQLICVITGKGEKKVYYKKKINEYNWKRVRIITPWLETEDYPRMLASADLGVCLHKSTSGLDLPMKVVDMIGCGLPVTALNFKALPELINDKVNGLIFNDSAELSQQLQEWFKGFPEEQERNSTIRSTVENEGYRLTWEDNWNRIVWPFFSSKSGSQKKST